MSPRIIEEVCYLIGLVCDIVQLFMSPKLTFFLISGCPQGNAANSSRTPYTDFGCFEGTNILSLYLTVVFTKTRLLTVFSSKFIYHP